MEASEKFDLWCIIELFGHSRMAGKCTEQNIAGNNFLRVDVPETTNNPPFTRFLNSTAIYSITPVTEVVARDRAQCFNSAPICEWDIREAVKKIGGKSDQRDIDDKYYPFP